jgi:hypothetical protein
MEGRNGLVGVRRCILGIDMNRRRVPFQKGWNISKKEKVMRKCFFEKAREASKSALYDSCGDISRAVVFTPVKVLK